eukprot:m.361697 g.361697  ORF g.361697 m.361697 type:complete len:352 (-) comp20779_c0_seq29:90-1145(-)
MSFVPRPMRDSTVPSCLRSCPGTTIAFNRAQGLTHVTCGVSRRRRTFGGMYPSGIFVPSIAIGGSFGRAVGQAMMSSTWKPTFIGSYAVMGSAAFLGGVTRVTISLAAIFTEATNEVTYLLPLTMVLIVSKFVADRVNRGIYDMHLALKRVPILEWNPDTSMERYTCEHAMIKDVNFIVPRMLVTDIVWLLHVTTHHGFPVVKLNDAGEPIFYGMMQRHQLLTLLMYEAWEGPDGYSRIISETAFNACYPTHRYRKVHELELPEDMTGLELVLDPYIDVTVFTLLPESPLTRGFQIFRYLGLRHLPIVDKRSVLRGMLARDELTEYKLEELNAEYFPNERHDARHPPKPTV